MSAPYRRLGQSAGGNRSAAVRDWGAAVTWAVAAGAREAEVLGAWLAGRAVPVPTGVLWDMVRVVRPVGIEVLERLRSAGVTVGPVLDVPLRAAVEFVVPPGTARSWPHLPGTICVGPGVSRFPAPHLALENGRRAQCGRRWLTPMSPADAPVTNSDVLCECLGAVLAHRAAAYFRLARERARVSAP